MTLNSQQLLNGNLLIIVRVFSKLDEIHIPAWIKFRKTVASNVNSDFGKILLWFVSQNAESEFPQRSESKEYNWICCVNDKDDASCLGQQRLFNQEMIICINEKIRKEKFKGSIFCDTVGPVIPDYHSFRQEYVFVNDITEKTKNLSKILTSHGKQNGENQHQPDLVTWNRQSEFEKQSASQKIESAKVLSDMDMSTRENLLVFNPNEKIILPETLAPKLGLFTIMNIIFWNCLLQSLNHSFITTYCFHGIVIGIDFLFRWFLKIASLLFNIGWAIAFGFLYSIMKSLDFIISKTLLKRFRPTNRLDVLNKFVIDISHILKEFDTIKCRQFNYKSQNNKFYSSISSKFFKDERAFLEESMFLLTCNEVTLKKSERILQFMNEDIELQLLDHNNNLKWFFFVEKFLKKINLVTMVEGNYCKNTYFPNDPFFFNYTNQTLPNLFSFNTESQILLKCIIQKSLSYLDASGQFGWFIKILDLLFFNVIFFGLIIRKINFWGMFIPLVIIILISFLFYYYVATYWMSQINGHIKSNYSRYGLMTFAITKSIFVITFPFWFIVKYGYELLSKLYK